MMKSMVSFLTSLLFIYVGVMLGMFLLQRKIMFLPEKAELNPTAFNAERMTKKTLTTSDNVKITAWHAPAQGSKPTILYFHGNAFHVGAEFRVTRYNRMIDEGFGVLAVSYRSYGDSEGSPTEQGLYHDGRAAVAHLYNEYKLRYKDIILMGESMGSGVAHQLATEYDFGAVIFDSPYTSTIDVAQKNYWWLPVSYLIRDKFESWKKIGRITAPVTIIHGDSDDVIPVEHGKRLYSLANQPKKLDILIGGEHVDAHPDIIMAELVRLDAEYFQ